MSGEKDDAENEVQRFLDGSRDRFPFGSDPYYLRLALRQALLASREGNYAIGAVAVLVDDATVREFHDRSAMTTGAGVIDHAEVRALIAARRAGVPDAVYTRDDAKEVGLSVFGTLEPCPMCVCALTNARVKRSVSAVLDGELVVRGGVAASDGGASAIGRKALLQPRVWQAIQSDLGLDFELLSEEPELSDLSRRLFLASREDLDRFLSRR